MPAGDRLFRNPFVLTKAVDLNDQEIQSLWVGASGTTEEFAEFTRPASPMPTFIMGGKGSGKTHLMRYHSFELQTLRYKQEGLHPKDGVSRDGYIGVYMRCSGLNSNRFDGRRQPSEKWDALFAYYVELWLTQHLLEDIASLELCGNAEEEAELCKEILGLLDTNLVDAPTSLRSLSLKLGTVQKSLDYAVNNSVMTGHLAVEVLATGGKLIFGIPPLLVNRYSALKNVLFVYSLDEFENLTERQQRYVNTLVREKELPATFRIGSRLYGVKTHRTNSAGEENLRDSEFETLPIDVLFRQHKSGYSSFAERLVSKRLKASYGMADLGLTSDGPKAIPTDLFEAVNEDWGSPNILNAVKGSGLFERRHFIVAAEKLCELGLTRTQAEAVLAPIICEPFPLLEKVGLLHLYQDLFRGKSALESAISSRAGREALLAGQPESRFSGTLSHYKADLLAQLYKENGVKQIYAGLDTFISMSAGLPRSLLTILRSVYDWSNFRGEEPLRRRRISVEAQVMGVRDASDWFYDNMRKAGDDGVAIQAAIDRVARLFRINRFSDKPTECSLVAFSVPPEGMAAEPLRILKLAESRSFINQVRGGHKDKNSGRVLLKFQINNMLSPRWDLPIGRRGTHSFNADEANVLFDLSRGVEFEAMLADWSQRRLAPFFGKSKDEMRAVSPVQASLFE